MEATPRPDMAAVVLAGGLSTRFGSDKASALLDGRPLLQWVVEAVAASCEPVVVVRATGQALPALPGGLVKLVVEDRWEARGPLAGLATGLGALGALTDGPSPARSPSPDFAGEGEERSPYWAFAASCDMPLLSPALPAFLYSLAGDADVVLPVAGGQPQPLAALYRVGRCLPHFERLVEGGRGKLLAALEGLAVREVRDAELEAAGIRLDTFANANDPAALATIAVAVEARAQGR